MHSPRATPCTHPTDMALTLHGDSCRLCSTCRRRWIVQELKRDIRYEQRVDGTSIQAAAGSRLWVWVVGEASWTSVCNEVILYSRSLSVCLSLCLSVSISPILSLSFSLAFSLVFLYSLTFFLSLSSLPHLPPPPFLPPSLPSLPPKPTH